jgi:hypothetical protein
VSCWSFGASTRGYSAATSMHYPTFHNGANANAGYSSLAVSLNDCVATVADNRNESVDLLAHVCVIASVKPERDSNGDAHRQNGRADRHQQNVTVHRPPPLI